MMERIRIGQIGIGHNHGSEKMNTLRRLSDLFEVVGVVEDDPQWRRRRERRNLRKFTALRARRLRHSCLRFACRCC